MHSLKWDEILNKILQRILLPLNGIQRTKMQEEITEGASHVTKNIKTGPKNMRIKTHMKKETNTQTHAHSLRSAFSRSRKYMKKDFDSRMEKEHLGKQLGCGQRQEEQQWKIQSWDSRSETKQGGKTCPASASKPTECRTCSEARFFRRESKEAG